MAISEQINAKILSSLQLLASSFHENELAYLALTGKPELAVRDRLAYNLHSFLDDPSLRVAREWRRSDLAVLCQGKPVAIVEIKAMFHYDAIKNGSAPNPFAVQIQRDLNKARSIADPETLIYALLLSVHPQSSVSKELDGVVKYSRGINHAFNTHGSANIIRKSVEEEVQKWCSLDKTVCGTIDGGSAFNIPVEVGYWLFGPYHIDEEPDVLRYIAQFDIDSGGRA